MMDQCCRIFYYSSCYQIFILSSCSCLFRSLFISRSKLLIVHLLLAFTDRGTVQKVIVLPRDDLQTEELVLEEVEVFKV